MTMMRIGEYRVPVTTVRAIKINGTMQKKDSQN